MEPTVAIFFWVPLILFGLFVIGLILWGIVIVILAIRGLFYWITGIDSPPEKTSLSHHYDDPNWPEGNP